MKHGTAPWLGGSDPQLPRPDSCQLRIIAPSLRPLTMPGIGSRDLVCDQYPKRRAFLDQSQPLFSQSISSVSPKRSSAPREHGGRASHVPGQARNAKVSSHPDATCSFGKGHGKARHLYQHAARSFLLPGSLRQSYEVSPPHRRLTGSALPSPSGMQFHQPIPTNKED